MTPRFRELLYRLRWVRDTYPRAYWNSDHDATRRAGPVMWLYWIWRERLTRSGRWAVWSLLFVLFLEMFPGMGGPTLFIGLLLPVLVVSWSWTLIRRRGLSAEILGAAPALAGGTAEVRVRLHNASGHVQTDPGAMLWRTHESIHPLGDGAYVPSLRPGEQAEVMLRVRAPLRGVFPMRGALALSPDPLGLFRSRKIFPSKESLVVRPRRCTVSSFAFLRAGESGSEFARALAGEIREPEIIGLRPYRDGDSPRDVDHRAWARRGKPVSRERGGTGGGGIHIAVDAGVSRFSDRPLVDPMVQLAAGVAEWLDRQSALGGLFCMGKEIVLPEQGRIEAVQDALAALPRAGWSTAQTPVEDWSALPAGEPVLLFTCQGFQAGITARPGMGGGARKTILVNWCSQMSFADAAVWTDPQAGALVIPLHLILSGEVFL